MSWTQIIMIVVIGVFLLGPERIPTAVQWVTGSLKKLRGMAQGAQQQLTSELGPEIAEMRRQIAELQGLKEMQSLKELKDLNPRAMITKTIFGTDEAKTAGGVAGLLGLDPTLLTDPGQKGVSAGGPAEVTARAAAADPVSFDKSVAAGPTVSDPLPVVGGSQEKVQPAAGPDPMPPVGASADPGPAHVQQPPAPEVQTTDPIPAEQPRTSPSAQADPLPAAGPDPMPPVGASADPGPAHVQQPPAPEVQTTDPIPAEQPRPAPLAQADPLPGATPKPPADPLGAPAEQPSRPPAAVRPEVRTHQAPLVVGGDPLPQISRPDPIPSVGS